jgi:glyoxylase-like metal-dependent hydrolase (beta-lactamase superfamily II)
MVGSLRQVLTLDDQTLVLPGHGDLTTIGRERATNAYLQPGTLDRLAG